MSWYYKVFPNFSSHFLCVVHRFACLEGGFFFTSCSKFSVSLGGILSWDPNKWPNQYNTREHVKGRDWDWLSGDNVCCSKVRMWKGYRCVQQLNPDFTYLTKCYTQLTFEHRSGSWWRRYLECANQRSAICNPSVLRTPFFSFFFSFAIYCGTLSVSYFITSTTTFLAHFLLP